MTTPVPATQSPDFNSLIARATEFVTSRPDFFCRFAARSFSTGKAIVACLPFFNLDGVGINLATMTGSIPNVREAPALQSALNRHINQYVSSKADVLIMVDPTELPADGHFTGYNRAWSLYTHIKLATIRVCNDSVGFNRSLDGAPDHAVLRSIIHPYTAAYARPEGFELFGEEGVLSDGTNLLHYFTMNPHFPQSFPRWAPLNMAVITNLTTVRSAIKTAAGGAVRDEMELDMAKRTVRPYDSNLPYVIPGDRRFDPVLLTQLIERVEAYKEFLPRIPAGAEEALAIATYWQLRSSEGIGRGPTDHDLVVMMSEIARKLFR